MGDTIPGEGSEQAQPDGAISRRRLLQAGGAVAGGLAAGPLIISKASADIANAKHVSLPYKANTSVKGNLDFWHLWASPLRRGAVRTIIAQFNQIYKNVHINDQPFPIGDIWTKNTTAVAANSGQPDVIVSDRPRLYVESTNHVYESLSSYVKRDKISGSAFWPFTWYEANIKGHVYGLPYETDCRVLFYNREMFSDAGLGNSKAPVTWANMKTVADKLDKKNGSGWDVVGFYPLWGPDLSAWVWDNRGDCEKKFTPTLNSPQNIQTGQWLKDWTDRYGLSNLNAMKATAVPGHDLFESGKTPVWIDIPGYEAQLTFYNPNFKTKSGKQFYPQWGVGLIPYNTGGKPYSFSGGFALSMPRNSHRSKATSDAAWEFIKYMTFVGQRQWAQLTSGLPTVKNIALHDSQLNARPHWKIFMKALAYGHAANRNPYDPSFPADVIGPAQDAITSGKQSPKDALDAAQQQALTNMKRNGGP